MESMVDWSPVTSFVEGLVTSGRSPAAAIAIAVDGMPVLQFSAGHARPGESASDSTLWPVASISKLYSAAAIMRLVEQGTLTLGLPVGQVIPTFASGDKRHITLRHLLTHTSGLPYESPQHTARLNARWTVDDFIDEAMAMDLEFRPGTRQHYSDLGFALASRVASIAAGRPFPQILSEEVLMPAGLTETHFPTPAPVLERVAQIDGTIGDDPDTAMYNSPYGLGLPHPAFGVVASLNDLLRFGLLFDRHRDGSLLSAAAVATMTSDQTCSDDPGDEITIPEQRIHAWGIGFMIKGRGKSPELVSPESYGHGGATGCYLWIDPRYRVTVAFVSNRHYGADNDDFMPRLDQTMNVVMATVSR